MMSLRMRGVARLGLGCALAALLAGAWEVCRPQSARGDELRMAIVLSRHGVRAPLASEIRGNEFNRDPWPAWPVAGGVLTEHGALLLQTLGAYYRAHYAGILGHDACDSVFARANQSQRTIASAEAWLRGLAPGCKIQVETHAGGPDPLFAPEAFETADDRQRLAAAIRGQLGDRPEWWAQAYEQPLKKMQAVLLKCTDADCKDAGGKKRLMEDAARVEVEAGELKVDGPVSKGADFAEHFLLQYAEGMPMQNVGWGRVPVEDLRAYMAMNTSYHDFVLRTPEFAHLGASSLASALDATLAQAANGRAEKGAVGSTRTRLLLLAGHDANLTWLGGLLHLGWLLPDEPLNATPPGSALVLELHRRNDGSQFVNVLFVSQTLAQMREATPLDEAHPPTMVPVFVPGCSESSPGYPCALDRFHALVQAAVEPRFVH